MPYRFADMFLFCFFICHLYLSVTRLGCSLNALSSTSRVDTPLTADWLHVCFGTRPWLGFLKRFKKIAYPALNCGQVWWPMLRICALHLTHPSAHTHTVNTHPEQWAAILMRRLGNSWGFSALFKGLTSVVVFRVEESTGYSLPPQTIPAGLETRTRDLQVTSPTLNIVHWTVG